MGVKQREVLTSCSNKMPYQTSRYDWPPGMPSFQYLMISNVLFSAHLDLFFIYFNHDLVDIRTGDFDLAAYHLL